MSQEDGKPGRSTWRRSAWIPFTIVLIALAASIFTEAPARLPFAVCLFRNVTNLPCPACGITRAFNHMGHGRIVEAWHVNALSPFLFVGLCAYVVLFIVDKVRPGIRWPRISRRVAMGLFALLIAVVLVRWGLALRRDFANPDAGTPTLNSWVRSHLHFNELPTPGGACQKPG